MKKHYHRKKHYSRVSWIGGFQWFIGAMVQIIWAMLLLIAMPYIIPAYIFVVRNPLFLIPVCIGIILIIGGVYWYIRKKKREHYMAIQKFSEVMNLSPREFEEFVEEILKQKWFHTNLWRWIKDGGIDVTATLGDKKFFVQCKRYWHWSGNITVEKIRELNGVMNGEIIPAGWIFVTTTGFTSDAISDANKFGIDLWDRNYLKRFLEESNMEIKKQKDDYWICESCGWKLVLQTAHVGDNIWEQFLWCEYFPECHFTKNI